ncbi:MAG: argininosuccinate lyase [Desulfobacteraceae bacterium 4572_130]|nr:MAG: argininosuccinate lyase [Desulfobacteraceae bacterium 4572_130]
MTKKLWNGRFSQNTDKIVEQFTCSIDIDKELYSYDIRGSIAHLKMLAHESIIKQSEADILIKGLLKINKNIENNKFEYSDSLEDIHMHIEQALGQETGKIAKKLHTGRSRNDQVALDMRMYLKAETKIIMQCIYNLQKELIKTAKKHIDVIMPGYTHLQRAQPVLFSHHLMAYYEMFKRDFERLKDSLKRIDVMPLGAAALAGTTLPLNSEYTKNILGFARVSENSIDSVSDRDFVMEFISTACICMIHLSRFSEELVIWSSFEFSFITISDAFTTGSSIMPQKKNPDIAELVRGKTGRIVGNLVSIITIMKSLPLAYNRDMQEDKIPLFDTVKTLKACINIYSRMIPNIKINNSVMYSASKKGFLNATDLADYLVVKGMPFREAHMVSGKSVAFALSQNKELHELSINELRNFSNLINNDIFDYLSLENMISRRISFGGTAYDNVKKAIQKAEAYLMKVCVI